MAASAAAVSDSTDSVSPVVDVPQPARWVEADDDKIREVSEDYVRSCQAYLLLYAARPSSHREIASEDTASSTLAAPMVISEHLHARSESDTNGGLLASPTRSAAKVLKPIVNREVIRCCPNRLLGSRLAKNQ